ncbi:MAG: methyltransferase domain-containing protein [Clostridiales bacterium]|nr:methyltransferase domain-containing protein [Clostridiales bacterium]
MDEKALYAAWKAEEDAAHIHGWDFSHIHGRYEEENNLPWDYEAVVRSHLSPQKRILDFDTGGGEFLLSLHHPHAMTAATEGYPPNVTLCERTLRPLGIDFRPCDDASRVPFADASFDLILNRHGDFCAAELHRLLRPGGLFITEQVGSENDRDLVERVLPGTPKPFPQQTLAVQRAAFEAAGFSVLRGEEVFRPIVFTDVGAFVWFARIIEWEFPGFSVDSCFDRLLAMQRQLEQEGRIEGTIHRFLLVAQRKSA